MVSQLKKINMPTVLQGGIANTVSVGNQFSADMAQSRFFTVNLDTIDNVNGMKSLPVKSISYTVTGIDTMSLPIGVFKDIPIPTGKKLPRITLTLIDDRMEQIESQIREWYEIMIPTGSGTIGYLDDMIGVLTYESYDTSGDINFSYQANVILTEDLTMSRDYETNGFKILEISFVVLKDDIRVKNALNVLPQPDPIPEPKQQINENNNFLGPIESNPFNIESTVQPIFKI
ncbi:MAG: hypothetical protein WCY09_09150 [Candidatus Omnitrophota bacterium]